MSTVPQNLKYAQTHEWVLIEGNTAVIGITDHAQHELTDVVFVEVPALDRTVQAGEACAVVESVKTASDIYSPLSGRVLAVNADLAASPGLVNSDPYGAGWLFKLDLTVPAEIGQLLSPDAYRVQIGAAP